VNRISSYSSNEARLQNVLARHVGDKYEGFLVHSSQIYQNGNKSIYYVHKVDVQWKLMPYVAGYGTGLWARSSA